MAKGIVYYNKIPAGYLEKKAPDHYLFTYEEAYFQSTEMPPVSLTLPKSKQVHESNILFPFFAGLLSEGINKDIQCRLLKIDETDDFTRLLKTAGEDTIGAITVTELKD